MTDADKTRAVAALLVEKHGRDAVAVVFARATDCAAVGDHEGARTWSEVAEKVSALLKAGTTATAGQEPPFGDALDGSVTNAVMDADGVQREALNSVISGTKKELDPE